MEYNNSKVRRQDRLLEEQNAADLLHDGEFGVLSMVETRASAYGGYGIPVNYVWDGKDSIYFHCAPEGHKLDCIKKHPEVSFCVVGRTNVISHKFTTAYESIMVRGIAVTDIPAEERMHALEMILEKYSPDDKETGMKYAEKSFHRTAIIRLDITSASGKRKQVLP